MNLVDLIVVALAVFAALRGWRLGLLGQVFELGGGFGGLLAGLYLGPHVVSWLPNTGALVRSAVSLLVVFIALSIGQTLGYLIGRRFGAIARRARLRVPDSFLGSVFGVAVVLVSFWLVGSLLVQGPSRMIARALRGSRLLSVTNSVLPDPPDVLAYLRQYLDTSGFPQVFAGLPRPIGPPVRLPSNAKARQAVRSATKSTVRVVVSGCGGTQLGSGWVSAPDAVVTNAHVVAGGRSVTVDDQAGRHPGFVVMFDPEIDIAVIRTSGLAGPPLPLDTHHLDRGAPGAILGFPGGVAHIVAHRAAVSARFEAHGKDIYGRRDVFREVYELRTPIRQGDSGGPFVVPDGRVAGVDFAASTTNSDIGYALTGSTVVDDIRKGNERTTRVPTGPCVH
ncbi:MAG TPA: MarP family serine protease [Actinomycetota bacterium]|nr:MarP family serine protease [Actinomycetota bacterium]